VRGLGDRDAGGRVDRAAKALANQVGQHRDEVLVRNPLRKDGLGPCRKRTTKRLCRTREEFAIRSRSSSH
jgi:hypothetical protein